MTEANGHLYLLPPLSGISRALGPLKSTAQGENKFRDGEAGSTFSAAELAEVKAKHAAFVNT